MHNPKRIVLLLTTIMLLCISYSNCFAIEQVDSNKIKEKKILNEAKVKANKKSISLTIRNVDISKFPEIGIICEGFNLNGEPLDTLYADSLTVVENGVEHQVISVNKISVKERVPVDFIFVVDKTGTMQKYMDAVKDNIIRFTNSLMQRGIDFRLGLVFFSDIVDKVFQPTDNVYTFISWLNTLRAAGGGDEKENALEAMKWACKLNTRPSANKVMVLITDAPYHQKGENGDGTTNYTTKSMIKLLNENEMRVFAIVPSRLPNYKDIATETRGNVYDLEYPFSTILNNFSNQLTNLFSMKYRTGQKIIPDSVNISILNEKKEELVNKTIPVIELGRKMIIDNLLYKTNSSELADDVPEMDVLFNYMKSKPNVKVMIEGHTDNVGSNKVNDKLSLERAESVKRYLMRKGISEDRIKTKGYGKRKPLASNDTEFGKQLNRRTEIIIIAK